MSDSSPSFTATDANCKKLRAFSLHLLSHRNTGLRGMLIALGTKAQVQLFRFSGFHQNHFSFRSCKLLTLFTRRFFFSSTFCLCSLVVAFDFRVHKDASSFHKTVTSSVSFHPFFLFCNSSPRRFRRGLLFVLHPPRGLRIRVSALSLFIILDPPDLCDILALSLSL